jgi:prolyl oligopeptidase
MKRALPRLAGLAALLLASTAAAAPIVPSAETGASDPYGWLEDVHGARPLAWVEGENTRTAKRLEADARFETFRREALAVLTAKDRIPAPAFLGDRIANLWQDETHVKGVWRVTSPAGYASAEPVWETLLDLDALSKAEGRNWIFRGAPCLPPAEQRCLVRLSNGGGDAVEIREFDVSARRFVEGGFRFSSGKQDVEWLDADTVLVARDWGPGTLTESGYAFVVKTMRRSQTEAQAVEVYRGAPTDVRANAQVLRGPCGKVEHVLIDRSPAFFQSEWRVLQPDGSLRLLDLPRQAELRGYVAGRMIISINEPWAASPRHPAFKAGTLVAYDPRDGDAALIAEPSQTQTFDDVVTTRDRVLVQLLDNVNGALDVYGPSASGWTRTRLPLPVGLALSVRAADNGSNRAYVQSEGFLAPPALWSVDAELGQVTKILSLTAKFDASKDMVEQHFATSTDGTRIPYFLVRPKTMKPDGTTPVQMFGYGGFLISETPTYRPELGKLWLERGGAYVLTNIRGGGEFGPAWHDAALRENRQRAFDDFAAVARDLIATGVTSPKHLGIYGRSNGGVLTSVSITQNPELFNAAVIESPLIDMLRYNHLSAGASWVAEYGNPDVAEERAFIARYSAYTRLQPGATYPEPYITTNTEDDRVHPGHPRKFAAALQGLGKPYLYYENTFGGHANDADPELNARRWARHYVYLTQKLMDPPAP